MRVKVSKDDDALYFRLVEHEIVESEEIRPGLILDFDESGEVVGVEFLNVKAKVPESQLTSMFFESS